MKLTITDKDRKKKVVRERIRPPRELDLIDFLYTEDSITLPDLKLFVENIVNTYDSEYELEICTTFDGIDSINYIKEIEETDEEYENRIKKLEETVEKNKVKYSKDVKKITKEKRKKRRKKKSDNELKMQ